MFGNRLIDAKGTHNIFLSASLCAFAIFSGVAVGQAPAQSNAERVVNGYHTPSHDYDLIHQRIEVKNFDWDSTSFDGLVTTTLVARRQGLDSVILDMDRQLAVRSVSGVCSRKKSCPRIPFARPGDSLVVRFAQPAPWGDTLRFTIDYHGRIAQGRGLYFFKDEPGRPHRPQQVYSGGGTDGNPRWIPTWGAPDDKATWEVIATVPKRFTVVSNGRLVSDRPAAGGMHTAQWSLEKPASTYLISLVVAPLARISDRWRRIPVDYYVYPEDRDRARALFGVTPDMMETYSHLTGVPYPWNKYDQVTVADFVGGMENVSATTLVDWLPDAAAYRDRPWYQYSLIPHELAHQWFGDLVTAENWANYWLNEGMAEFMPGQYWGSKMGERAEEDYYLSEYRDYVAADKRRRMPLATWNSNNVYPKGALVLEMLKKQLGPERFWASINRYLTDHAYRTATSDDLRQAVLDATGENLGWFWSQWIYRAGYPAFSVTSAFDSAAGTLTLSVRQTQVDSATADSTGLRFETPLAFRAPMTIRVGTSSGDVVTNTVIDRREQTVTIDGLRAPPTMVVFDAASAVVKTLDFDQPTSWLATLLEREGGLWNRAWAIEQLRQRKGDSLAATTLAHASRAADHPAVRALAAGALGEFPPAVALPALEAAAGDTSSRVRKAAVTSLGALGGDRTVAVVRAAWTSDPSYEVRAAALTALSRIDSAGARAAILDGLATPSYRDVIQNAAVLAVLQRPDSGLIDALSRQVATQPLPSIALAVLASRGNPAAVEAFARVLDDERAWVRELALQGLLEQLDRDDVLGVLRAALPGVRNDGARAAVQAIIDRLGNAKG
ncbi:MAG: M1 family aminopeptidase [Gemmatimonadales bacterium]